MKTPTQTTQTQSKKSGFTLIEIVIVLAIAALIMVIVFVAVSGAQRSRRDTERRANASRVLAGLTQCAADNKGTIGTTTVKCGIYITNNGGVGDLSSAVTLTAPSATTPLPGPYAQSNGTNTCAAAASGTAVSAMASTTSGGNICVYYWSEASNGPVLLAGTI